MSLSPFDARPRSPVAVLVADGAESRNARDHFGLRPQYRAESSNEKGVSMVTLPYRTLTEELQNIPHVALSSGSGHRGYGGGSSLRLVPPFF